MHGKRVLIVDDEKSAAKGLKYSLEQEGYKVETANDGEQAYNLFLKEQYDILLLDLMMPKIDGFSLCKMIREKSNVPIIMLTGKTEDVDKIVGLELGADDYVGKPYNTRELIARIRAVLRRVQETKTNIAVININRISINVSERKVSIEGSKISLTDKEFDLLVKLAKNPGEIYSREQLLELIWGYDFVGDSRTVDVHIRRLREKIEETPSEPQHIMTKWGVGYYFQELK